jgi:hypothetical protein
LELSIQFPKTNLIFEEDFNLESIGYTQYCLTIIDHFAVSQEEYKLYFNISEEKQKDIGSRRKNFFKKIGTDLYLINDEEEFFEFESDDEINTDFSELYNPNRSFKFYCLPVYNLLLLGGFDYSDMFYFRGEHEVSVIKEIALENKLFLFKVETAR